MQKINNKFLTFLAGTIQFVQIGEVFTLFTFRLDKFYFKMLKLKHFKTFANLYIERLKSVNNGFIRKIIFNGEDSRMIAKFLRVLSIIAIARFQINYFIRKESAPEQILSALYIYV